MEPLQKFGAAPNSEEQEQYEDLQWELLNGLTNGAAQEIATVSDQQLGRLLRGLLCEADHNNWDSCSFHEVLGSKMLIRDLAYEIRYARKNGGLPEPTDTISYGAYGVVNPDGSVSKS
jgi:hypothetical protein